MSVHKKPIAWFFEEGGPGLGTSYCNSKEKALKLMQDYSNSDCKGIIIDPKRIQESVMFNCGECDTYTIDSSDCCWSCENECNKRSMQTFNYYFTDAEHAIILGYKEIL